MFSVEDDEVGDVDIQIPQGNQQEGQYSFEDSSESRRTVMRTRKKASVSGTKDSGNNESNKAAKKPMKK